MVGGRVPDMIFNSMDRPVFRELLRRWELDNIDGTQPVEFADRLIEKIRSIFNTKSLQSLHGDNHKRFDIISDTCIELVGIPSSRRRGTKCLTNVSAALLFFGDCREHAFEMLSFFDFWQKLKIDELSLSSFNLLHSSAHDPQRFAEIQKEIAKIAEFELRGAHVGVYSKVRMIEKYKHDGYADGKPFQLREYSKDDIIAGNPLTDYELKNSLLLCTSGPITMVVEPTWDATTSTTVIPNVNGVPVLEAMLFDEIVLFNLIEDHTMTFLVHTDTNTATTTIQCKDSFYNEIFNDPNVPDQCSPYQFGDQVIDFISLKAENSIKAGTLQVADSQNNLIDVPVRIKLLPFSKRTDAPEMSNSGEKLHFLGLELDYCDVAGEIIREQNVRAANGTSRRDVFLNRIHDYALNPNNP